MTLRTAQRRDLAAVSALEEEIFGVDAWSVSAVSLELARAPGTGVRLVAVDDRECVGYTFASLAGSSAELHRLAVRPASRRRGLGSALLDGVVQRVRRYDCDRLLLEVADTNTAAVQMYQRRGFAELSRRRHYYRSGADALVLALELHQRRHVKQRGGSAR